jgi:hypothetical protein
VHIYTNNGGTLENSLAFLQVLDSLGISYLHKDEDDITQREIIENRIVFLHSKLGHNDVITDRDNFTRLLKQ